MDYNQMGSKPVVVQGQSVNASVYGGKSEVSSVVRGEVQPKRFNDAFWAFFFYCHLVALVVLSVVYVPQMNAIMGDNNNNRMLAFQEFEAPSSVGEFAKNGLRQMLFMISEASSTHGRSLEDNGGDVNTALYTLTPIILLVGFLLSIGSLTFMMRFAEPLIKFGIGFNILTGVALLAVGILSQLTELIITGAIFFVLSTCYACMVWNRIPFAATNLVTAATAIRANMGLSVYAYISIIFMIGWILWWALASTATVMVIGNCDADFVCENDVNGFIIFLFLVSLFWTQQVIKNVVHVTVAGTVGTWWWSPSEANGCCSTAVRSSNQRALTHSFGSICLGSLLVAIVQAIRQILKSMRESDDGILVCIAECLIGCLEAILEYFNEWAFVYVGLYGYTFIDAAKNVITLFKTRGWTTIITDSLIDNVLSMVAFGVGLVTGGLAALLAYAFGMNLEESAFFIGLIIGAAFTSVLMGVVGSGANTVIVCYAEDPAAFQENYPVLADRMRATWREAYPDQFRY